MARNIVPVLVLFLCGVTIGRGAIGPALVQHIEQDLENVLEWIRIPTVAGEWIWTHRLSVDIMLNQRKSVPTPRDVQFVLYTRRDTGEAGQQLELGNVQSFVNSTNFRSDRPTKVIVHGWQNSKASPMVEHIRDMYLHLWDYNVIVVDWSVCSLAWNYAHAVACVPMVGQSLAGLLDELQLRLGLTMESVYIVGHSLGAHIAGVAGKAVQKGQIHTIVALDPALPLFSIPKEETRIGHQDAMFVEIIHTNGGLLGFLHPIGTADFYPNGGSHQPGCGFNVAGMCSHSRAWELFVESLMQPEERLLARKVDSFDDVQRPVLLSEGQLEDVERVKMGGEPCSAGLARGIYLMSTRDRSPFFV